MLVTGLDPHQIDLGGFECPDAVLTKPCRPETLTAVFKLLEQRPKTSGGPAGQANGVMRVRCPLCGAPGAQLAAHGSFVCQACGKEGILQWDQFIDGGH